jgi:hypothetical protein
MAEAALPSLSGVLFHDRNIPVGLISYHFPAPREAGQNRGFGSALCQEHETMTFIGLSSASICVVHYSFFHDEILFLAANVSEIREVGDEVSHPNVFMLGCMKLTRLYGLIVENLTMTSSQNFLRSGHGVSLTWKEPNLPLAPAFQIKTTNPRNRPLPI